MNRSNVLTGNSPEEMEALFSEFLIDSWSYSKVRTFSRNEKAFEMFYIYNYKDKKSTSNVAGSAYHEALLHYFMYIKNGKQAPDIADLQAVAFNYIEDIPAKDWKIQKTISTVEEGQKKATKTVSALLENFFSEIGIYTDELEEVLMVEEYLDHFIVVNGVDIPLPCHAVIDLAIRTKDGKTVLIDHKSKASYTDDKEAAMSIGLQAIVYILMYEAETGNPVDEVWFVENKYSKNRDGSKQLQAFKVAPDEDLRRLYEARLYEPLRRMIAAVNDPDYIYMINEDDNFIDKAEIYEFWAKTQIAEISEFDISESKKPLIEKRLKKVRDTSIQTLNPKVVREFKKNASEFIQYDLSKKDMTSEEKIQHSLRTFGIITQVAHKFEGYSSDTFLLEIGSGTKIKNIYSHKLDLANALDVNNVRLSEDLVMYEGKSYLGIELAKKSKNILKWDESELKGMKIPIGKDNYGGTVIWDLENHSTPHALICGATGSGKSVCIKSTLEYALSAGIDDIYLFDPKFEFTNMNSSKVQVINEMEDIEDYMEMLVMEMNNRVKNKEHKLSMIVFDEFADAVSAAKSGSGLNVYKDVVVGTYQNGNAKTKREVVGKRKSLEENMKILLQKGRSSGFRIISATQRASTKVITGDAKVNFPVQICFRVQKEIDSRVVLDEPGAESLSGMGDGLIRSPEYSNIVRFQGFYKS